ncbi:MAG: WHG domain-containing protein [Chloroflexota bacterium]
MPAPARTSIDAIVHAGQRILEAEGIDGLTMRRVAVEVGVRAPSLYKHVRDRDHLVRLVATAVLADLTQALAASIRGVSPGDDLAALAAAYRAFGHARPGAFALLLARVPQDQRVDAEVNRRAAEPVLRVAAALAGPGDALAAARLLTAWASGFVSMELAGAFRLGGDPDAAFHFGVERLVVALGQRGARRR